MKEGSLFFFTPFYYNNGARPDNKFFVVLKKVGDNLILGSLPTSVNKVPNYIALQHGCLDSKEGCFNCYHFTVGAKICNTDFSFEFPTFIYGYDIEQYSLSTITQNLIEGIDYELVGDLLDAEYESLMECLKNSSSIRGKILKLLQ